MRILITGATGFVGRKLVEQLLAKNNEIVVLTRDVKKADSIFNRHPNVKYFNWENNLELPPKNAFDEIDGVINLMGENIGAKNWSSNQKEKLKISRINATENLVIQSNQIKSRLKFFINASAVGIYPVNNEFTLDENSQTTSNSFLSKLCTEWELPLNKLADETRKVTIRTAVVLDKNDGALKKMLPPFLLGLGGKIGNGNQMMSWIHIDDLVNIYVEAISNSNYTGVINACSPNPVSNKHFTNALGKAIHRPTIFPVPAILLKTLFGEMSCIILDSQKIVSCKLETLGFKFKYRSIESAFAKIFS